MESCLSLFAKRARQKRRRGARELMAVVQGEEEGGRRRRMIVHVVCVLRVDLLDTSSNKVGDSIWVHSRSSLPPIEDVGPELQVHAPTFLLHPKIKRQLSCFLLQYQLLRVTNLLILTD